MPLCVLNFIETDGVDLTKCAVLQAENDNVFDGIADMVPQCPERFSRFLPRKSTRPTGQKQHVDFGQLMPAVAPRNFFQEDGLALAASYAAHRVQQKNLEPLRRDKFFAPLGELIVTRRVLAAAGTNPNRALARPHADFDAFVVGGEPGN